MTELGEKGSDERGTGPGRHLPIEANSRMEKLLEVALDLFARNDFSAVTIKDIAKASDVSTSLIYYYFDSKRDLFDTATEHAIHRAHENYKNIIRSHQNPVDRINDWFKINLELHESLRKLVRIMFNYSDSRSQSVPVDKMISDFYGIEHRVLAASIREGVRSGVFKPVNPDRMARLVSIHIDGIFLAAMIRRNFRLATAMNDLKRVLWQLLGYGARSQRDVHRSPRRKETPRVRSRGA